MSIRLQQFVDRFIAQPGKKISLTRDFDPGFVPAGLSKENARVLLRKGVQQMARHQDMLYAQHTYAVLIILQGMDASGKDGVIKHVMSGINPQGCEVHSFKAPSNQELGHDYMWRCSVRLPERGRIGIFNRSYYEEVLVVRVHPELLDEERIPTDLNGKRIWKRRFEEINNFERYLTNNGIQIIKLYLNLSKEEQRRRFLERIEKPEKNWKLSVADITERAHWEEYLRAYEDAISNTSTDYAPWYVVPADHKWFARLAVSRIISARIKSLRVEYPKIDEAQREQLVHARRLLEHEVADSK
jgi:PPK2 family polyphosphate:nucleotide phosphotransferase